jgi:hypothetical protein
MALDPNLIPSAALFIGDYEATCTFDGSLKKFKFSQAMRLQVGDPLPRGDDPNFDTCNRCKRKTYRVSKVPARPAPAPPRGFWKVPTE